MACELRKAARVTGEDFAAHHSLVKMIPQWERGNRAPASGRAAVPESLRAHGRRPVAGHGIRHGFRYAARCGPLRAGSLPGLDQIRALATGALAKPRETVTPS
jgi:hypothetical protein